MHRRCEIIGVGSGWGAQVHGCEDGPEYVYKKLAAKSTRVEQKYLFDILYPIFQDKHKKLDKEQAQALIIQMNYHLSQRVHDAKKRGLFPIVIGGDHSIAVGTWNGVKESMGADKKLGMVWIDAHMDSHIPSTSPSGALHGMPLAALMGCGDPSFCMVNVHKCPILPQHTCVVGVRSFESGEAELLRRMNVRVIHMDEVKRRGFEDVIQEAVAIASKDTDGFGVSFDLDVIDPKEAPGVGSPESGGLLTTDVLKMLSTLISDTKLQAFEIVEFNPHRDRDERTACIAIEMIGRLTGHGVPMKK